VLTAERQLQFPIGIGRVSEVATASSGATGLAGRYAQALFELATERGALDAVAGDLATVRQMLGESADLVRLVRSPVIKRDAAARAIGALAQGAGFNVLTGNFLGLLARNRRLFELSAMIAAFQRLLADSRGEIAAEVVSATPLAERHIAAVADALKAATGAKVALSTRVDPALLGGMIVRVGSRMVDSSLRTKLQKLELAMKGIG
jgi:F-type H+-transporting ATPase subunit delta